MSTVEERMQNAIEELEQENCLLRARNDRLEAELKAVPVLSAGPITSEMVNWSAEDKAELVAVIAKHTVPVQEPIGYFQSMTTTSGSRLMAHQESLCTNVPKHSQHLCRSLKL